MTVVTLSYDEDRLSEIKLDLEKRSILVYLVGQGLMFTLEENFS